MPRILESDISELRPQRDPKNEATALRELFSEYEETAREIEELQAKLTDAMRRRSNIVEQVGAFGRGPYRFRGHEFTVAKRTVDGGHVTWFFKEPAKVEAVHIDSAPPVPEVPRAVIRRAAR